MVKIRTEKAKYVEIRKFINHWLVDPLVYCNNCGFPYFPGRPACCNDPIIGKNIQHCQALMAQNRAIIKTNLNQFGSNESKTLRHGASLPPDLIKKLEQFCQETMGEKLFVNQKDFRGFCKAFPMFTVMEKI
jgi:hypothetical protein